MMSEHRELQEMEEVYFVPSDEDESNDNGKEESYTYKTNAEGKRKTLKTIRDENYRTDSLLSPLSARRRETADDILFGDVYTLQKKRMRLQTSNSFNDSRSCCLDNNNNNSQSILESTYNNVTNNNGGTAVNASMRVKSTWFAGGSPVAMPRSCVAILSAPRSLSTLRGMTSLEVRVRLMSFFTEKEKWERVFAAALPLYTLNHTDNNSIGNVNTFSESHIRQCDRYARLVNIRNWNKSQKNSSTTITATAVNNYTNGIERNNNNQYDDGDDEKEEDDDVLLPAELVTTSSFYLLSKHTSNAMPQNHFSSLSSPSSAAAAATLSADTNTNANATILAKNNTNNDNNFVAIGGTRKNEVINTCNENDESSTRTLRKHQIDGIRFLWSILVEGPVGEVPAVGCILAHTMGLGKTAQVVIFLHLFMCAFHHQHQQQQQQHQSGKETQKYSSRHSFFGSYDDSNRNSKNSSSSTTTITSTNRNYNNNASTANYENKLEQEEQEQQEEEEEQELVKRQSRQRVLIVVPKSTMAGWLDEFTRWSRFFPQEHRLTPMTVENCNAAQRVQRYYDWRRHGGVLLIGYEALVKLLQLIEEDQVIHGIEIDSAFRLRQSARLPRYHHHHYRSNSNNNNSSNNNTFDEEEEQYNNDNNNNSNVHDGNINDSSSTKAPSEIHYLQSRLAKAARRGDEGGTAYGGIDDPFTELIICDEAHRLKSVHLQVVQAIRGLHPLRRLLLTGTPLQNHLGEYWAMVDFALHKYFDRVRFKDFFVNPIEFSIDRRASQREIEMARKKTFTLITEVKHFVQRVDSTPLKEELPPLHEYIVIVPLSDLQKDLYVHFLQLIQRHGGDGFQFLPAVSMAGKIAAHPQLVYSYRNTNSTNNNAAIGTTNKNNNNRRKKKRAKKSRREDQAELLLLSEKEEEEEEEEEEEHYLDQEYEKTVEEREESNTCDNNADPSSPLDEDEDEATQLSHLSFSTLPRFIEYEELCHPPSPHYTPSLHDGVKMYVAMQIIILALRMHEKVLLFSLSTTLLDLFEEMLRNVNHAPLQYKLPRSIRHCRLDGSHTSAQRANTLNEFNKSTGPDLFLLSMKAGGLGITITSATRVILIDTSFNPADDQQAIGRAFRYGQRRPVFVYRLLCMHTLEYTIFEQKLAKEWLFKTIVEETAIKRDKLSGMHVKEVLALLYKSMKALQKPLKRTPYQEQGTQQVLDEDELLRQIDASLIVYAQKYGMFLEYDHNEQYGEAEQRFYDEFKRHGLFDVDEMNEANRLQESINAIKANEVRKVFQAHQMEEQRRTLTDMVDELICSRVKTDPHLYTLLKAMGVHIDEQTGRIQPNTYRYNNVQPSPLHQEQQQQQQRYSSHIEPQATFVSLPPHPHLPPPPTTTTNATTTTNNNNNSQIINLNNINNNNNDNSMEEVHDVDINDEDVQVVSCDVDKANNSSNNKCEIVDKARVIQPLVNPQKYEPYKPGASHELAIAIEDEDESSSCVIDNTQ